MGSVCSSPEARRSYMKNREIDRQIRLDNDHEVGNQKLLLLGTGECGKSTILKQMQILHNNGFSDEQLRDTTKIVYSNVLNGVATLVRGVERFVYMLENQDREMDARRIISVCESGKDHLPFTPVVYSALQNLWADKAIQRAFARRSELQLGDSIKYFLDHLDRIAEASYKPNLEDMLHLRVPTTGVVQVTFPIKGSNFQVYDVGGQRSERRKWIHLFDNVNAIIYICAINEYDQQLREDNNANRMRESMDLFHQIACSKWFAKSGMILFLNKKDLFAEKITTVPITVLFKDYKGAHTYEETVRYVSSLFHQMNDGRYKKARKMYIHETCATDTSQVQFVIDSVLDTVIGKNLVGTGME